MWLHRFAKFVALSTFVLILAGGMVTSTGSGLAVPDWPNSYGYFMFSFPLSYMVGGIFYEHGHRLIASTVGLLTIVLTVWLWRCDPRTGVKRLGVVALVAVVLQGMLGGLTVLYFLPAPISVAHAATAEIFFCLTVGLALFTSPGWIDGYPTAVAASTESGLERVTRLTTALIFVQILVGATMRHTGAGLAIPDFPLAFGRLVPPTWDFAIGVHFAHRIGAVAVLSLIAMTLARVWPHRRLRPALARPAILLMILALVQVTLGAFTIWTARAPIVNTAHVGTGALVLATSFFLTLRTHRRWFATSAGPVAEARETAGHVTRSIEVGV